MSLKMKLTSTICAFFLILGLVIMGVFAAPQASVNLGGTITFKATDVYANVYGSITGAVESETAGGTLSLTTLNFEAGETTDTSSWANVPLTFNDNGGMITISITIENLATDRELYATITDSITGEIENLTKAMKIGEATYEGAPLTIPEKTGDDTNKVTIDITMKVDNPNFSLADELRYGYAVKLSNEDLVIVKSNDETLGIVSSSVTEGVLSVEVQPQEGAQFVGFKKTASGSLTTSAVSSEQEFLNLNIMKSGAFQLPYVASNMLGFDETLAKNLMSSIADNIFMDYSVYLNCPELVECVKDCYEQLQSDQMIQEEFIDRNKLFGPMPGLNDAIVTLATGKISYSLDYTEGDKYQAVFIGQSEVKTENGYTYEAFSDAGFSVIKNFDLPDGQSTDVTLASTLGGLKVLGVATDFVAFLEDDYYYYVSPFTDKCTSIIFPDTYTVYAEGLCMSLELLNSVKIGSGATSIPAVAFNCCSSLASIVIPNSVTSIGAWAFSYCDSLESIDLPLSLISLEHGAFEASSNLETITIPEGVTSIGDFAFASCSSLTGSIVIPEGATSIGSGAFHGCSSLTSITIPSTVTNIAEAPFAGCDNLTYNEYDNGYYLGNSKNQYVVLVKAKDETITSCEINSNTKFLDSSAFYRCSGLTSIVIPASVTSIGNKAFYGCSGLTSITIPEGVTSIGSSAFENCSGLESIKVAEGNTVYTSRDNNGKECNAIISNNELIVGCKKTTIPEGVTSIGMGAFEGCSGLTSITIPSSVTSIGHSAFWGCSGLTSIELPNSLTSIGSDAFYGCSGLTSITIPSSVTSIGSYAFRNCSGLTSIVIPSSVTSIGNNAFEDCSGLTSIVIPEGVTSIGDSAFRGCEGLTSINIPKGVTSIGSKAFYNCRGLTSITIPEGVTSIGSEAFLRCSSLTSITIPSSVTSIGDSAFWNCFRLTSITITEGVTSIGDSAFDACWGLTSITIPSSVTSIGNKAFNGCSGLANVYYTGSAEEWTTLLANVGSNNERLTNATIHYNYVG